MKKIFVLSGILIASLLFTACLNFENSEATDTVISGDCGESMKYTIESGTLTISGTGNMKDYGDYEYMPWHPYKDKIEKVVVESGVTSIDSCAFYQFTALKSAIIGDSVIEVPNQAFVECSSLESVIIGDSAKSIGVSAFSECTSLKTVQFGKSIESFGEYAFEYCDKLESFTVSEDNKTFKSLNGVLLSKDSTALIKYAGAAKEYVVPGDVKTIKTDSFDDNVHLKSLIVPDSVVSIENGAFRSQHIERISIGNITDATKANGYAIGDEVYDINGTEISESDPIGNSVFLRVDEDSYVRQQTYKITFILSNDESVSFQYYVGEKIALPDVLTKKGLEMKCTPDLPETMPEENLTVTVTYEQSSTESGSDNTTTIIIAAVAVVIVAGLAGFFIINRH